MFCLLLEYLTAELSLALVILLRLFNVERDLSNFTFSNAFLSPDFTNTPALGEPELLV